MFYRILDAPGSRILWRTFNGVTTTIRKMTRPVWMWCRTDRSDIPAADQPSRYSIKNFVPIGGLNSPNTNCRSSLSAVLHMIEYIQRERFTERSSAPQDQVGLTALLGWKDARSEDNRHLSYRFSPYVRILTRITTWRPCLDFMHWSIPARSRLPLIRALSSALDRSRMLRKNENLSPRIGSLQFNPETARFQSSGPSLARTEDIGLLYVGRISKEKNLNVAVEALSSAPTEGIGCGCWWSRRLT